MIAGLEILLRLALWLALAPLRASSTG